MNSEPKDMSPVEIKVALIRSGVSQVQIAKSLGINPSAVSRVIDGSSVSHRVRKAVAEATGIDLKQIWPSTYIEAGGPRKPGRPVVIRYV